MSSNPFDNAFPLFVRFDPEVWDIEHGLTKREYFAAIALQGLTAGGNLVPALTAKRAVDMADALVAALNQSDDRLPERFPGSLTPDAE